jgi:hypothetical protein
MKFFITEAPEFYHQEGIFDSIATGAKKTYKWIVAMIKKIINWFVAQFKRAIAAVRNFFKKKPGETPKEQKEKQEINLEIPFDIDEALNTIEFLMTTNIDTQKEAFNEYRERFIEATSRRPTPKSYPISVATKKLGWLGENIVTHMNKLIKYAEGMETRGPRITDEDAIFISRIESLIYSYSVTASKILKTLDPMSDTSDRWAEVADNRAEAEKLFLTKYGQNMFNNYELYQFVDILRDRGTIPWGDDPELSYKDDIPTKIEHCMNTIRTEGSTAAILTYLLVNRSIYIKIVGVARGSRAIKELISFHFKINL